MAKPLNSKQRRTRGLLGSLQGSTIPLLLVAVATGLFVYEAQRAS